MVLLSFRVAERPPGCERAVHSVHYACLLECLLIYQISFPFGFQGMLFVCMGFNGPLRQYFSLYRAVLQRRRKKKNDRR